jgi:hypothetical protein
VDSWESSRYIWKLSEISKGRDNLRDLAINGKIILKKILNKQGMRMWTSFLWHRIECSGWFL